MITASLLPQEESVNSISASTAIIPPATAIPNTERTFLPAAAIFKFDSSDVTKTYLRFYNSSKDRYRGFCSRCGVGVMYQAAGLPGHFPDCIDFRLGTVDKVDLEKEWMVPDRHLWWERGIEWVQRALVGGAEGGGGIGGLPKHEDWRCDAVVGEDIE